MGGYSDKSAERAANKGGGVRFLLYFLYLLIFIDDKVGFNFIKFAVLKEFVRIYLYIVEDLLILST